MVLWARDGCPEGHQVSPGFQVVWRGLGADAAGGDVAHAGEGAPDGSKPAGSERGGGEDLHPSAAESVSVLHLAGGGGTGQVRQSCSGAGGQYVWIKPRGYGVRRAGFSCDVDLFRCDDCASANRLAALMSGGHCGGESWYLVRLTDRYLQ